MTEDPRIRPCKGTCGKMTRPSRFLLKDYPNTVSRMAGDMCASCTRASRGETKAKAAPAKVVDVEKVQHEVDVYLAGRKARLERNQRRMNGPRTGTAVYGRGPAAVRPARPAPGAHQVGQGGR